MRKPVLGNSTPRKKSPTNKGQLPKNKQLLCIWADRQLVLLGGATPLLIEGDPCKTLATFAGQFPAHTRLEVHYQASDLLILPPQQGSGSLSTWLNRHLPPGTGLAAYLLAFSDVGKNGAMALLPKASLTRLFAAAGNAGFFGVRVLAMPDSLVQACTLHLASGFWRVSLDKTEVPHFLPLPKRCMGQRPAMLMPQQPVADYRQRSFGRGLFRWEDDSVKVIQTRRANRRLLTRLSLVAALVLGLVWLGLGWRSRQLESLLVSQRIAQKSETQMARQFTERRAHLSQLNEKLTKHPFAKKSATYAGNMRLILNACPPQVVLARVQIQVEPGHKVCFLEGFSPDTSQPLAYIKNLANHFDDQALDLMQLDALPEKQRQADERLQQQKEWFRFTIRLENL